MTIGGVNYRLTKHGRKRFIQRLGMMKDADIIRTAVHGVDGFRFVWKRPDKRKSCKEGLRLVTVLGGERRC